MGSGLVGPGRGVGSPRRRRAASIAPLGSPCTSIHCPPAYASPHLGPRLLSHVRWTLSRPNCARYWRRFRFEGHCDAGKPVPRYIWLLIICNAQQVKLTLLQHGRQAGRGFLSDTGCSKFCQDGAYADEQLEALRDGALLKYDIYVSREHSYRKHEKSPNEPWPGPGRNRADACILWTTGVARSWSSSSRCA